MAASSDAGESTGLTFEQRKELLLLQVEVKRLEPEERRLRLVNISGVGQVSVVAPGPSRFFDVSSNLRLVPQFCERDPDTFFSLF